MSHGRIVGASLMVLCVLALSGMRSAAAQEIPVGIIDFYGLKRVSESAARGALTFKEGTLVRTDVRPAFIEESKRQLSALPGVASADVNFVCCDDGRAIIYVGVEERSRSALHFRDPPVGAERLAADVVATGGEFDRALMAAVQRGTAAEDDSQGHSLATQDPAMRALEERFIVFATRDLKSLRSVLRNSSDAEQRALAAQVLGYAADKQIIVGDLVYGMSDPDGGVRNNAMRALAVIASMTPSAAKHRVHVPYEPFVDLLRSPVWTDRNKSSFVLMHLTENQDPRLLSLLRRTAMGELVEMARWKSRGHALPALLMLGRIGGLRGEVLNTALSSDDRDSIINAALKR